MNKNNKNTFYSCILSIHLFPFPINISGNSSSLPVPKTNAQKQYDTRVRVVSFYACMYSFISIVDSNPTAIFFFWI
jgi:hypothetical protein